MRIVMLALVVLALCGFGSCGPVKQAPPEVATIAVKERAPVPTWATEALVKPMPKSGKVGDRLKNEDARGQTIDLANCHRKLLRMLDKGEKVDPAECKP